MPYKTIVLELLESQPALSEKLKASSSLLSTMEMIAIQLRTSHLQFVEQMHSQHPDASVETIRIQALEYQINQLQQHLHTLATKSDLQAITVAQIQQTLLSMMTE
ncbi:MAG: hypothetical protein KDB22_18940 [Planctomycetales bacterium]|nr:hypothetical protein [Planctomycetales bacterium]